VIDFRYHVVSIVAVFLALTLGIVIGTTQLDRLVLGDLRRQVTSLQADNRALQQGTAGLRQQIRDADSITAALTPRVVAGALVHSRIVLVATPQAGDELTDAVQKVLEEAGAQVTGRIQLAADYTDPQRAADLKAYVTSGGQPAGFQLPETDDASVLGAALLSYVLVRGGAAGGPDQAAVSQVLSGFASLQMLRTEGGAVSPGDYAVLVAGEPVRGTSASARAQGLGKLAAALDRRAKGVLVAGTPSTASPNGLVGAVRADASLSAAVSTVDNANTPAGRIAAVFALAQQGAGRSGQYGAADSAQAAIPPTPAS
jgi:Copper transport outer membrane protein, MctB